MNRRCFFLLIALCLCTAKSWAQESDTSIISDLPVEVDTLIRKPSIAKRHSPTKAVVYSALVPGLGQAYNKKFWKIPIVYAGFAGFTYGIVNSSKNFRCYRNAYRLEVDQDPLTEGECNGFTESGDLRNLRDLYKRRLDLLIIGTVLWHSLGIIDAAVDAHLFEFDVSDDLSLSVQPDVSLSSGAFEPKAGIKLTLHL